MKVAHENLETETLVWDLTFAYGNYDGDIPQTAKGLYSALILTSSMPAEIELKLQLSE